VFRQQFEMRNAEAQAARQQQLADEKRKIEEEVDKQSRIKAAELKAMRDNAPRKYEAGVIYDPVTNSSAIDPNYTKVQGDLARQRAQIDAANRQAPEFQQKAAYLRAHGATEEQINQMMLGTQQSPFGEVSAAARAGIITPEEAAKAVREKTGVDQRALPPTAEAKTKLALLDNAIANATKYRDRVVRPDGSFADIESMSGDTPQLIQSAVQDMLYAKSGASAPQSEVDKAHAMYAPSRTMGIPTERDTTAAAKVNNLINDLQRMRNEIGGSGSPGAAQTQQAPAQQLSDAELLKKYGG
jgi:hypothetical protein